mmetsp:Transcript_38193/g.123595  ORF Transcript_38193/g.123595 Transcript_38193/m.123595 type:complete len:207 (+) Transcript_38193:19-639(+)
MPRFVPKGTAPLTTMVDDDEEDQESETASDSDDLLGTHISDDDEPRRPGDRRLRAADPEKQAKFEKEHEQEVHTVAPDGGYMGRNFHGAFTGGWSAGYFNSVGSKEGWAPSEWKSSRGARTEGVAQRVEDFMDDEDLAGHQAERRVVTRGGFSGAAPAAAGAAARRAAPAAAAAAPRCTEAATSAPAAEPPPLSSPPLSSSRRRHP